MPFARDSPFRRLQASCVHPRHPRRSRWRSPAPAAIPQSGPSISSEKSLPPDVLKSSDSRLPTLAVRALPITTYGLAIPGHTRFESRPRAPLALDDQAAHSLIDRTTSSRSNLIHTRRHETRSIVFARISAGLGSCSLRGRDLIRRSAPMNSHRTLSARRLGFRGIRHHNEFRA